MFQGKVANHTGGANIALSDSCTPTGFCTGDAFDGDDVEINSSGGCDNNNNVPKDCITINTDPNAPTHVNYIIAQAVNCTNQYCVSLTGNFIVNKAGRSRFLTSESRNIPPNGFKYGWKWTNGGVGWNFPSGTELCAGFIFASGGNTYWMSRQYYNIAYGACKVVHS